MSEEIAARNKQAPQWLLQFTLLEGDFIAWTVFCGALCQFLFFTWWTFDQPIIDGWGFRPAQTAITIPYMLREGAWVANLVPVFGEPWTFPLEFPFYQWCTALLSWITDGPVGGCGRLVSAFFAVAILWPLFLLAEESGLPTARRVSLLVGALWLFAPVVVFWGRSVLIETTVVFLSVAWLAFFVRFLTRRNWTNYLPCIGFGVVAAMAKITILAGFVVAGLFYTCFWIWQKRRNLSAYIFPLTLAGTTLCVAAAAFLLWGSYTDKMLIQNPLTSMLRVSNIPGWYFGAWSDRWSFNLWGWAIRSRDLPEALGNGWPIAALGLVYLALLRRWLWLWVAIALIVSYLSVYLFFPRLHTDNVYYQIENVLLLCASVAVIAEGIFQRGHFLLANGLLVATVLSQVWSLYTGVYRQILFVDYHKHPYYQAGLAVQQATPPEAVVVVFGTGFGSDVPYFAARRGFVVANWCPESLIETMLFEQRRQWFGGRNLGAMVDCSVFEGQRITPALEPIRDALKRELNTKPIKLIGPFNGLTIDPPSCDLYLPRR
jgi:hypothetical protein